MKSHLTKHRLTAAAVIGISAAMALSACSSSSSTKTASSGGQVTLHFFGADYGTAGTANSTQLYSTIGGALTNPATVLGQIQTFATTQS